MKYNIYPEPVYGRINQPLTLVEYQSSVFEDEGPIFNENELVLLFGEVHSREYPSEKAYIVFSPTTGQSLTVDFEFVTKVDAGNHRGKGERRQ